MNEKIAIVDDEMDILTLVSLHLRKQGFQPVEFSDAESFLKSLPVVAPSLVILDLMLPDSNGLEVCKVLRREPEFSTLPIIMLTAKSEEFDRVLGLELGADDYIVKPFSPRELVARVKAVLRRQHIPQENAVRQISPHIRMDVARHLVLVDNQPITLTTTEFNILRILSQRPGWVFSREQLLNSLWGDDKIVIQRTIDVHIKNLREKLGEAGTVIKNIRGVGYKIS